MSRINRVKLTRRVIDALKPVVKETWTMAARRRVAASGGAGGEASIGHAVQRPPWQG